MAFLCGASPNKNPPHQLHGRHSHAIFYSSGNFPQLAFCIKEFLHRSAQVEFLQLAFLFSQGLDILKLLALNESFSTGPGTGTYSEPLNLAKI